MKKTLLVLGSIGLLMTAAIIVAATLPIYTLSATAYSVDVELEGIIYTVDLPTGTEIGGTATEDSLILAETREFETEEGDVTIEEGAPIQCEPAPGYPDICGGLS